MRFVFLFGALAAGGWGQTEAPFISREGILQAHAPQWLEPEQFVPIYGRSLAPPGGCREKLAPQAGVYPTDACETYVTVNGIRAGLQYIGNSQINIKLPAGLPVLGEAAIVVTVRGRSSPTVTVPIGKPKLKLSLVEPAYVHMPIWIAHNVPVPYLDPVRYPIGAIGGKFEVRRNGVLLKPLEIPRPGGFFGSLIGGGGSMELLALHLQYRFDQPGKYEIRYIGTRMEPDPPRGIRNVVEESEWTEIEVQPYPEEQRRAWIRARARELPSSPEQLISKALPDLLAMPDAESLPVILPLLYHSDESVRRYVGECLPMFDNAVVAKYLTPMVREKGPTEEIARLFEFTESLFEGGHQAFLPLLPGFLNSPSARTRAGALQYLIWAPNHPWGKSAEAQARSAALVMRTAPGILEQGDARLEHLLALALGGIRTDASREMLWRMIQEGRAAEQSKTALTWIGDPRDLPRLAGVMDASLPDSLHRVYGEAALPLLRKAARETNQPVVRMACAKELVIAGEPEGFQYLAQVVGEMPSFKGEILAFVRDRFRDLRDADEGKVLAFMKERASTAR